MAIIRCNLGGGAEIGFVYIEFCLGFEIKTILVEGCETD